MAEAVGAGKPPLEPFPIGTELLAAERIRWVTSALIWATDALETSSPSLGTLRELIEARAPAEVLSSFRWVCSMRSIPFNAVEVMGAAQTAHWAGFGGDGDLWRNSPLEPLASISVGKIFGATYGYGSNVEPRLVVRFSEHARAQIVAHAASLFELLFRQSDAPVRVVEDGCGPGANFSCGTLKHWRKMRADAERMEERPLPRIQLTACDVNPAALLALHKWQSGEAAAPEGMSVKRCVYRDLTCYLTNSNAVKSGGVVGDGGGDVGDGSGDVGGSMGDFGVHALPVDAHDVYAQSFVWHQLGDDRAPAHRRGQLRILRAALRSVRVGGLVFLADAGPDVWVINMMAPINLFDREGCLPTDLLSAASWAELSVPDPHRRGSWRVACELPGARLDFDGGILTCRAAVVVQIDSAAHARICALPPGPSDEAKRLLMPHVQPLGVGHLLDPQRPAAAAAAARPPL